MPVSNTPESLSSVDLVKEFVTSFEKKHRNLQKRKSKLDGFKERLNKGESLRDDQRKALESYDAVVQNVVVVQEVISQSNQLIKALDSSEKRQTEIDECRKQEYLIENFVEYLYFYPLFEKLKNPRLRSIALNYISDQQLLLLDRVKSAVHPPLPDLSQDVCTDSLKLKEILLRSDDYTKAAENLHNLLTGSFKFIPVIGKIGPASSLPKRICTFKEARSVCMHLLGQPLVNNFLNGREDTIEKKESEKTTTTVISSPKDINCEPSCEPAPARRISEPFEFVSSSETVSFEKNTDPSVECVIEPFKGGFNFLQASQVECISGAPNFLVGLESTHFSESCAPITFDTKNEFIQLKDAHYEASVFQSEGNKGQIAPSGFQIDQNIDAEDIYDSRAKSSCPSAEPIEQKHSTWADILRENDMSSRPKSNKFDSQHCESFAIGSDDTFRQSCPRIHNVIRGSPKFANIGSNQANENKIHQGVSTNPTSEFRGSSYRGNRRAGRGRGVYRDSGQGDVSQYQQRGAIAQTIY